MHLFLGNQVVVHIEASEVNVGSHRVKNHDDHEEVPAYLIPAVR